MKRLKKSKSIPVQSCITTVSFPSTLDEVYGMIKKHQEYLTDMEVLLCEDVDIRGHWWSAPRWLVQGDVLFFYHAKSAQQRVKSLLKKVKEQGDPNLWDLLKHSTEIAEKYGGTIFGFAIVKDPPEYLDNDPEFYHFKGRIFAPIDEIYIFKNPLSADKFGKFVKISQATITALDKKTFDGIQGLLSAENKLPAYLKRAVFSEVGFRNINKDNWLSIITGKNIRFIHETQVRAYFVDYLLSNVKDNRTPMLEECQCFRNEIRTGIADYFIKIGGCWIPVEAKLNILTEQNLSAQIKKYIQIDTFTPTKGNSKNKVFKLSKSPLCLVVDNRGVYLTEDGRFKDCSPDEPIWRREKLSRQVISEMRNQLQKSVK